MEAILRIFAFMGALGFGWVAFADEGKPEAKPASEESIQVVCPVNTEDNCEHCENCDTAKAQPVAENPENK